MHCELIDYMGNDLTVVNAARVSFDKHKEICDDSDIRLINFLASHGHWTPFGHPTITVRETIPVFVARQRIRHTVGFVYNEVSRRYVDSEPEFFEPEIWRFRHENKKQGSKDEGFYNSEIDHTPPFSGSGFTTPGYVYNAALDCYQNLLEAGVCPEQARMVLPLATYTSWYVTGSLAAWARAYNLRIDSHAQKEIQDLARMWNDIIKPLFPVSWEALTGGQKEV